jgi:hypothetical protein
MNQTNMENIVSKILLLPKEIQDIIGEFNVKHRPMMKPVLQVIRSLGVKCFICPILYLQWYKQKMMVNRIPSFFVVSYKC